MTDTLYTANAGVGTGGNLGGGDTVSVIDGSTCNARITTGCDKPPSTVTVGSTPIALAVDEAADPWNRGIASPR